MIIDPRLKNMLIPARLAIFWPALLVFITAGYFQNSRPGWNVNSQFALTCAIVERGTLSIDAYHARPEFETDDKAFFGGHYYCDKSPVTAFLGVPVFWVYNTLTRDVLGRPLSYAAARYWVTWWVAGLSAALLAAMTAALLMRHNVAPARAAAAGAFWIAATPLMEYSILLFSYLPACAMAMGGYLLVIGDGRKFDFGKEPKQMDGLKLALRTFAGGVLLGLAAWTLNTMALVALILTAGLALAPGGWSRRARRLAAWVLGGALGAAGNFIYTRAVFHTWGSPYAFESFPLFRAYMARGLMGATWPKPIVAWLITFHPFQGLFFWFPLAAGALAGCLALALRRGAMRREAALALLVFGGLLLYNSAYFMWWGGWAVAPRHLVPTLPFLALGLVPWLASRRRWVAWILWVIAAAGLFINLPAAAVDPQPPINFPGVSDPLPLLLSPEKVTAWPSPMHDVLNVFWNAGGVGYTDRNWGTALGLEGPRSLIPLVAIWVAGLIAIWLTCGWRKPGARRGSTTPPPTDLLA